LLPRHLIDRTVPPADDGEPARVCLHPVTVNVLRIHPHIEVRVEGELVVVDVREVLLEDERLHTRDAKARVLVVNLVGEPPEALWHLSMIPVCCSVGVQELLRLAHGTVRILTTGGSRTVLASTGVERP
jgi:hypothetical protein